MDKKFRKWSEDQDGVRISYPESEDLGNLNRNRASGRHFDNNMQYYKTAEEEIQSKTDRWSL